MLSTKRILLLLALCLPVGLWAQTKAALEAERQANLRQIQEMSTILEQTSSERQMSIGELYAINRQIEAQESYLQTLTAEIAALEDEVVALDGFIGALEDDLEAMREEYAAILYSAQKANLKDNRLLFLLSARSFNEFWMRLNYMEQYGQTRIEQAEQIRFVSNTLMRELASAQALKEEKKALLDSQEMEQEKLSGLQSEQTSLIAELGQRENELETQIARRKAEVEQLERTIAELVRVELARREAANTTAAGATAAAALSDEFQSNRSRLPWPVASGFISLRFGRQEHPVIPDTHINNDGVDIRTNQGETVRAVFGGTVTSVAVVPPPYHYAVIIRHGNYFTVYTKLEEVLVKNGQQVSVQDPIGRVKTNREGISELQFQIRRNTELLNPEEWLQDK